MVIVLRDGEEVHGYIEWYDKHCIKLNRSGAANLMIYKPPSSTCSRKRERAEVERQLSAVSYQLSVFGTEIAETALSRLH